MYFSTYKWAVQQILQQNSTPATSFHLKTEQPAHDYLFIYHYGESCELCLCVCVQYINFNSTR